MPDTFTMELEQIQAIIAYLLELVAEGEDLDAINEAILDLNYLVAKAQALPIEAIDLAVHPRMHYEATERQFHYVDMVIEMVCLRINGHAYDLYIDDLYIDLVTPMQAGVLLRRAGLDITATHNESGEVRFTLEEGVVQRIVGK